MKNLIKRQLEEFDRFWQSHIYPQEGNVIGVKIKQSDSQSNLKDVKEYGKKFKSFLKQSIKDAYIKGAERMKEEVFTEDLREKNIVERYNPELAISWVFLTYEVLESRTQKYIKKLQDDKKGIK